jgi:hypothetical protein
MNTQISVLNANVLRASAAIIRPIDAPGSADRAGGADRAVVRKTRKRCGMARWEIVVRLALALMMGGTARAVAQEGGESGKSRRLPAPVSQAIQTNRPGAEIDKLDVETEHGISFYDIEFKADQGEMDIAEDGTVLDVGTVIDMKDVPEPVAAAIRAASKGRAIKRVERSEVRAEIIKEHGQPRVFKLASPRYVFEAELTSGEVEVAADGTVIKAP